MLLAYSSLAQITERGNKMTIRIPPEINNYVQPFIRYEMGKFGKNVGIANADHDYAKAWTALFKPAWEAAGGKVVEENPMSYNKSTDFYSGVSRVMQGKPDVLFIGGPSEPTALVAKQARDLGFKGGFIVMDQAKLDEMAKVVGGLGPLEGSIGVMPLMNDTRPDAKLFVEKFRKAYPDKSAQFGSLAQLHRRARHRGRHETGRHRDRRQGDPGADGQGHQEPGEGKQPERPRRRQRARRRAGRYRDRGGREWPDQGRQPEFAGRQIAGQGGKRATAAGRMPA